MAKLTYFVEPLRAGELALKVVAAFKEICPGHTVQQFSLSTNIGGISLGKQITVHDFADHAEFKAAVGNQLSRPYVEVNSASITLSGNFTITAHYRLEAEKARAVLELESGQLDHPNNAVPVLDVLEKHFTFVKHAETIARLFPENEQRLIALSQTVIASFSAEAARLSQMSAESVREWNQSILEKTKELDTIYASKLTQLDETYGAKQKELDERETAFRAEVKEFDLRNNTAVRRKIFEDLKTAIDAQKTIKLSDDTTSKRVVLHILCASILITSLTGFVFFAHHVLTTTNPDWRYFVTLSALLATFATTAVFYVRWNDSWFREHARAEFANRKFKADMLRAGWIVEMFFEWQNKKEVPVPTELITSCTRGLFTPEIYSETKHPFDELQALPKEFSRFRIGKGSFEVERDSKPKADEGKTGI